MVHTHKGRLLILVLLAMPMLYSCVAPVRKPDTGSIQQQEIIAQNHYTSGDYSAAADIYLQLAETDKSQSVKYIIRAANAYTDGGDYSLAGTTLERIDDSVISPLLQAEKNIIIARIALATDDILFALNKLNFDLPTEATPDLQKTYFGTRGEAFQRDRQYINALLAWDRLGQLLTDTPEQVHENNIAIWHTLESLSPEKLKLERGNTTTSFTLAGWFDLAIIARTQIYDRQVLENALSHWLDQFPDHPGSGDITDQILAKADQVYTLPEQIALLLPFNEQYHAASSAIREGFMAAWYNTPGEKSVVRIYDSAAGNVNEIYQAAVNEGADFIVGPLQKDAVNKLVSSGTVSVNTLALNQIEDTTHSGELPIGSPVKANFFQFGLLPEDEAIQAADKARADGHVNVLIITPDSPWGKRISNAFVKRWQSLGGTITAQVDVSPVQEDYSLPVKQLLNIDKSEQRTKQLIATLSRPVISEPRFRRDADMIFLAATPDIARQLVPQLRFYRADSIPTYSLSSIYTGIFNKQANADIDNIIFSDMPWILSTEYEYSPMQQSLNRAWSQNESPYRRLYAFGIDAYQIIPELVRLYAQNASYRGKTGDLTLTGNGIIRRSSMWARFVNGEPQLLEKLYQ